MPIKTPKELFVFMLSDLWHGAKRSHTIYEVLGQAAQNQEIKEALDARDFISTQILGRLEECFRLIGEKPVPRDQRLYDEFVEGFRRELNEIQSPLVRKMFVLSKVGQKGVPPNPQMKTMTYFLPVMMTMLFFRLASGLNLYYLVSNVASIPQQWLIAQRRLRQQGKK